MTLTEVLKNPDKARVAFVATGGGAPGCCILAGYCQALWEAGIRPAVWSGTSAGAVVGTILSKDLDARRLVSLVDSLAPDAVISLRFGWWLTFLLFHSHYYNNDKAHDLIANNGPETWSDVKMPLMTWSTRMMSYCGERHLANDFDFDTPADAALASMSVPYLLPAFEDRRGELHQDGGIVYNVPIVPTFFDQYDHVVLLVAQGRNMEVPDSSVPNKVEEGLYLLRTLMSAQIDRGVEIMGAHANATVLYYPQQDATGVLEFNKDLVPKAYAYAKSVLAKAVPSA